MSASGECDSKDGEGAPLPEDRWLGHPYHPWMPFGDHRLKLERHREDQHGPCARMTRTTREA